MSGYANISAVPDQNILYNAASGQTLIANQRNQLLNQETQQTIGSNEMEMMARAAGSLMDPNIYPTPEARAAAYPVRLAALQAQGFAKNAPPTYPGDTTMRALAQMGTPSQTLSERQANIAANQAIANAGNTSAAPSTTTAPAAGAAGGDEFSPDKTTALAQIAKRESGGDVTALNYVAKQDPTAYARGATASGKYQIVNSTWQEGKQLAGVDTSQYPTARDAPEAVQDKVASALYDKYGTKPWQKGSKDWIRDEQGQYQMATVRPTAPPAPPGGGVVARNPGAVQVAGPGAGTPPASPTTPPDLMGPRPLPPTGPGASVVTPQQLANTPTNQVMPGAVNGPPAAAPPPVAPAAPAGGPAPPQMQPLLPNGLTARQQAILDAQGRTGQMTGQQRLAAEQAYQNQNIQLAQKQFSDYVQLQQLAVSQGQLSNSQAELNLKVWQANHPELAPNAREATIAYRALQDIAPKIRAGTATQDEIDRYNNAAIAYQDFKTVTDPISKAIVQVPSRPLPDGFPPPSGAAAGGGAARPLTQGLSPTQQQVERDPAAYKVAESQYDRDSKEVAAIGDAGRAAQADQIRIKEMQDVLQRFSTGPGTEARTAASAWLQRWLPSGITGWEKESANLSGSDAAQAFSKLALTGAGSQEQKVLGTRGGYQAIRLFKEANPNVNLQDATNKSILDMQLIGNQANQDYSQGALSHFADNEKKFGTTHQYDSLAQFDRNWNAQRNPQVYAAAMGAISGQQPAQWAKGLSDDGTPNSEYARVLEIVARAKPGTVVNAKSGRIVVQPPAARLPPGFTVVQ